MNLNSIPRMDIHSHSEYSNIRLIDSICKIPDMLKTANNLGMKGLVLTDHESLSGHLKWLQAEKKLKKEKQISEDFKAGLGNEIYLVEDRNNIERYWHYILVAKNNNGHRALRELSSTAWYNSFSSRGMTRVPTEKRELENIVKKYPNSLIATTACLGSELDNLVLQLVEAEKKKSDNIIEIKTKIDKFIRWNIDLFGDDFYIEIAAGTSKDQIEFNQRIGIIAKAYNRKIVIGSDAHYLTSKERPIHKAYLNSKEGEREVDEFYFDAHMMNNEEAYNNIKNIFSEDEFTKICEASMEIYNKIEGYNLEKNPIIPEVEVKDYPKFLYFKEEYPVLKELMESDNIQERYWVNQCVEALEKKGLDKPQYFKRLETEADIIKTIGEKLNDCLFKYFNTFQHFIDLFWDCGSIVGPGRGSAVGFLSNYLLGITQLDPIEWNLHEWRFLNKERVELPDIDTDLSPSKRKKIFEAIRKERGELNLIQVCTFGTEGTRSAIAAAGRGYRSKQYPNGLDVETTQYLSALIPQERGFLWDINDVVYGNEEKDRKPVQAFVEEVNKYPGLLEIIQSISGLVNKRGQHASGVMIYNNSPFETNAIMRSPNGDLTTQFELHDSDLMGDVKYDFLVTEICDKITTTIELMQKDNILDKNKSLRSIYDEYLHPSKMNLNNNKLWENLGEGNVLDVFQFSTGVGLATAKQVKPQNPIEMTSANAIMRLMGEKGKERPLDRYCRLKNNINEWYTEVKKRGLCDEEIKTLEPYYLPRFGVPALQEDLMLICMDDNIAHFTLKEANAARKTVAKKHMEEIPALKEKFISQCPNRNFGEYVWETTMGPQMGYSFSLLHSLAYSFVGIQTLYLATNYPVIYWNCACLIINAGGADLLDADDVVVNDNSSDEVIEEVEVDEEEKKKKKKNKSVNYGKISTAIGETKAKGIVVLPPDINKSDLIFKPDINRNAIIYGMKGINRIGTELVIQIFQNRPYTSIEDFLSKVKVNKPQMINLIKAGAFDELYDNDRIAIMDKYLDMIAEKKKRITLQNMNMLATKGMIPKEFEFEQRVFFFNKYIKRKGNRDDKYYFIDTISYKFFEENYDIEKLTDIVIDGDNISAKLSQTIWDNIYDKAMDPIRGWMKKNQQEILDNLNSNLVEEVREKYALGTLSSWEMDSLGFYYHEHELANLDNETYDIVNYFDLNEEPEVERTFLTKDQSQITMFKISRIAGTVIDKDKNKSSVTLLTPTGVVVVKVWKNQFAAWDKQISERQPDGKKKIIERSWFQRGNKLIITGIRRGDNFIPKKYKNTPYPLFEKINEIENGIIVDSITERPEVSA